MDHNPNREEVPERGAEGPEPTPPQEEEGAVGGSDSTYVSDAEDFISAAAPATAPAAAADPTQHVGYDRYWDTEVHHYHHRHCSGRECPPEDEEGQLTRRDFRQLEATLDRVVHNQERLCRSLGQVSSLVSDVLEAQPPRPGCRCGRGDCPRGRRQSPSDNRRRRSPSRGTADRSRSRWEPIQVLSPVRRRRESPERRRQASPVHHRRQSPVQYLRLPQGLSVSPAQPTSPPLGQLLFPQGSNNQPPRSFHLSPSGSPSTLGSTVRQAFPQFTEEQKRRTRNLLLRQLISLRLLYPNLSSVGGWRHFVRSLRFLGTYDTEADISLAWNIAFEQQTHAHFISLWNREPEVLRPYLPRQESTERQDLIHF